MVEPSILKSVKKLVQIPEEETIFDVDLVVAINTVFFTLSQLGIGPAVPYSITGDSELWTDFDPNIEQFQAVRTLVQLKVRVLFDPPTTSFAIAAIDKQIQELEWRLQIARDVPSA